MESHGKMPTQAINIPAKHILAAANDVQLKKLLRDGIVALRHVEKAQQEVFDPNVALAEYIAKTYPENPVPVEPAGESS